MSRYQRKYQRKNHIFRNVREERFSRKMSRENIEKETITWVPIELYGRIIGKNGGTKNEMEDKSGAKIKILDDSIQLQGTKPQRKEAKKLIHARMKKAEDISSSPDWSELTFVKSDDIGHIIGCLLYTSPSPRDS